MAPILVNALGVKIDAHLSIQNYILMAQDELSCKMSQDDFFTFMKKEIFFPVFVKWHMRGYCTDKVFVLFDDMVETHNIMYPDYTIRMIKV